MKHDEASPLTKGFAQLGQMQRSSNKKIYLSPNGSVWVPEALAEEINAARREIDEEGVASRRLHIQAALPWEWVCQPETCSDEPAVGSLVMETKTWPKVSPVPTVLNR
ncbi:MAG: hypothetical protein JOY60_11485 [Burkholderiaceae bacterium]|nr:hypothetical protein [Burkholderiaceae bacterium]